MSSVPPVVLLFRNDLRLADHAALHAALHGRQPVAPVFILDEAAAEVWRPGGASRWWLHHSLTALQQALQAAGASLVLRRGSMQKQVLRVVAELDATDVFAGYPVEPWVREQDSQLAKLLAAKQVGFHRFRTVSLFEDEDLRTQAGGSFVVYSSFARAAFARGDLPPPLPAPRDIPGAAKIASDSIADWALLPVHPDWAGGLRETWTPGEAGASARLRHFLRNGLGGYADGRDVPGVEATSMLSPHLHFGEISPAQVWHAVQASGTRSANSYLRELLWREFSIHLLVHHPKLPETPLRQNFAKMPWRHDPAGLRAWQRGHTGVPIVDAGMRQLWQTGWMHNRVRMITGSFLVKHLLVPWQKGEAWFWDTLVDADLANNSASWQWVAGSGADAAPYFRIFNPVLQGRKFDPDGAYVRRWVPELAQLDDKVIHAPWEASGQALERAGVVLGDNYPRPLVDLSEGRRRALDAYASIGGRP
jgi:deoxyribodipyrimidine photo-lyase